MVAATESWLPRQSSMASRACVHSFRRADEVGLMSDPFTGWRLQLPRRKRLPRALTRGEVASLLSQRGYSADKPGVLTGQMAIAVRLMVATGVRVGELSRLRVEDIAPDGASLRVHGKGSRDRIAYIADVQFRAELQGLVRTRERLAGQSAPVFVNRYGDKLSPQSVRLRLHRATGAAGLSRRITPHMLRHTAATLLIETGVTFRSCSVCSDTRASRQPRSTRMCRTRRFGPHWNERTCSALWLLDRSKRSGLLARAIRLVAITPDYDLVAEPKAGRLHWSDFAA